MNGFSSIFNSESGPARTDWPRVWLWAGILAVAALGAVEWALGEWSPAPGLRGDTAGRWARVRRDMRKNDPRQIALLGASRMQQDVDPDILAGAMGPGWRAAQLAVAGSRELPLLEDLADDPEFRGVAVFSFLPERARSDFLLEDGSGERGRAEDFIARFRRESLAQRWENRLVDAAETRFLFPGALMNRRLPMVFEILAAGGEPKKSRYGPQGIVAHRNRWIAADYDSPWAERRRSRPARIDPGEALTPEEMKRFADKLAECARRIRSRGGKTVLVRLPISGTVLEEERTLYAVEAVWEPLARAAKAPLIDFEKEESLSGFQCGDGSHLDFRDVPEFSRALAGALRRALGETL